MDTIANNEFAIRTTTILGSFVAGYYATYNYGIDAKIGICNSNYAERILSFMTFGTCASIGVAVLYDRISSVEGKLLLFSIALGFSGYQFHKFGYKKCIIFAMIKNGVLVLEHVVIGIRTYFHKKK